MLMRLLIFSKRQRTGHRKIYRKEINNYDV